MENSNVKVHFELEQDEYGYPPYSVERIWAISLGDDTYLVDSIPFYARNVSLGDKVLAPIGKDGVAVYSDVLELGGHSTIRVIVLDENFPLKQITDQLESFGCKWEGAEVKTLIAVDIPPEVNYRSVEGYLGDLSESGAIDYQESCIQHDLE